VRNRFIAAPPGDGLARGAGAVNIQEIAQRAGVSRSTVSYVLSGKRQVTAETRRRVMSVIDEAGYRPSAMARALAHGETRTLGLVIPPLRHHLSSEQLQFVGAVAEAAADRDYDILLSPSGGDREEAFDRLVGERKVDGILLMETRWHDRRARMLTDMGFPFVTIGRTGAEREHAWVDLDYSALVVESMRQLHAVGHRHIAFINRPQEMLDQEYGPALRSLEAFEKAKAMLGVDGLARCCEDSASGAYTVIDDILGAEPTVTAVVTINEQALGGVMEALQRHGRRVPQDVSVMAIASARVATQAQPPATAADVPAEQMSQQAVDALLRRISDRGTPLEHLLLFPSFVDRGSVAAAKPQV
jgi:DNA-binding LacI/PurR family transcriptional regulator